MFDLTNECNSEHKDKWKFIAKGGLPGGSGEKNLPALQKMQVQFLGREDSLEKEINYTLLQYSCLENSKTEEPGGLQCIRSQSHTQLSTHA